MRGSEILNGSREVAMASTKTSQGLLSTKCNGGLRRSVSDNSQHSQEEEPETGNGDLVVRITGPVITDLLYKLHRRSTTLVDTHVICKDGYIPVHRCVLMASSKLLRDHLMQEDSADLASVCLPDFTTSQVLPLINSFYTGSTLFKKDDLNTTLEIIQLLQADANISYTFQPAKEADKKWAPKMRHYLETNLSDAHMELNNRMGLTEDVLERSASEASNNGMKSLDSEAVEPRVDQVCGNYSLEEDSTRASAADEGDTSPQVDSQNELEESMQENEDDHCVDAEIVNCSGGEDDNDVSKTMDEYTDDPDTGVEMNNIGVDIEEVELSSEEYEGNNGGDESEDNISVSSVNQIHVVKLIPDKNEEFQKDDSQGFSDANSFCHFDDEDFVGSPTVDLVNNVIVRPDIHLEHFSHDTEEGLTDLNENHPYELETLVNEEGTFEKVPLSNGQRCFEIETTTFDEYGEHTQIAQIITEAVPKNLFENYKISQTQTSSSTSKSNSKTKSRKNSKRRSVSRSNSRKVKNVDIAYAEFKSPLPPPPSRTQTRIKQRLSQESKAAEVRSRKEEILFSLQLQEQLIRSFELASLEIATPDLDPCDNQSDLPDVVASVESNELNDGAPPDDSRDIDIAAKSKEVQCDETPEYPVKKASVEVVEDNAESIPDNDTATTASLEVVTDTQSSKQKLEDDPQAQEVSSPYDCVSVYGSDDEKCQESEQGQALTEFSESNHASPGFTIVEEIEITEELEEIREPDRRHSCIVSTDNVESRKTVDNERIENEYSENTIVEEIPVPKSVEVSVIERRRSEDDDIRSFVSKELNDSVRRLEDLAAKDYIADSDSDNLPEEDVTLAEANFPDSLIDTAEGQLNTEAANNDHGDEQDSITESVQGVSEQPVEKTEEQLETDRQNELERLRREEEIAQQQEIEKRKRDEELERLRIEEEKRIEEELNLQVELNMKKYGYTSSVEESSSGFQESSSKQRAPKSTKFYEEFVMKKLRVLQAVEELKKRQEEPDITEEESNQGVCNDEDKCRPLDGSVSEASNRHTTKSDINDDMQEGFEIVDYIPDAENEIVVENDEEEVTTEDQTESHLKPSESETPGDDTCSEVDQESTSANANASTVETEADISCSSSADMLRLKFTKKKKMKVKEKHTQTKPPGSLPNLPTLPILPELPKTSEFDLPAALSLKTVVGAISKYPSRRFETQYNGKRYVVENPQIVLKFSDRLSPEDRKKYFGRLRNLKRSIQRQRSKQRPDTPPPMLTKAVTSPNAKNFTIPVLSISSKSKDRYRVEKVSEKRNATDEGCPPLLEPEHPSYEKHVKKGSLQSSSFSNTTALAGTATMPAAAQPPRITKNELDWYQKELKRCAHCKRKYKTHSKASSCLTTHGFRRCLICLDLVPSYDASYEQHHLKFHEDTHKKGHVSCPMCQKLFTVNGLNVHITRKHLKSDGDGHTKPRNSSRAFERRDQHAPQIYSHPYDDVSPDYYHPSGYVPGGPEPECIDLEDDSGHPTYPPIEKHKIVLSDLSRYSRLSVVRLSESDDDDKEEGLFQQSQFSTKYSQLNEVFQNNKSGGVLKESTSQNDSQRDLQVPLSPLYAFKLQQPHDATKELDNSAVQALIDTALARKAFGTAPGVDEPEKSENSSEYPKLSDPLPQVALSIPEVSTDELEEDNSEKDAEDTIEAENEADADIGQLEQPPLRSEPIISDDSVSSPSSGMVHLTSSSPIPPSSPAIPSFLQVEKIVTPAPDPVVPVTSAPLHLNYEPITPTSSNDITISPIVSAAHQPFDLQSYATSHAHTLPMEASVITSHNSKRTNPHQIADIIQPKKRYLQQYTDIDPSALAFNRGYFTQTAPSAHYGNLHASTTAPMHFPNPQDFGNRHNPMNLHQQPNHDILPHHQHLYSQNNPMHRLQSSHGLHQAQPNPHVSNPYHSMQHYHPHHNHQPPHNHQYRHQPSVYSHRGISDKSSGSNSTITVDETSGSLLRELAPVDYAACPIPLKQSYGFGGTNAPKAVPAISSSYDNHRGGTLEAVSSTISRPAPSIFSTPPLTVQIPQDNLTVNNPIGYTTYNPTQEDSPYRRVQQHQPQQQGHSQSSLSHQQSQQHHHPLNTNQHQHQTQTHHHQSLWESQASLRSLESTQLSLLDYADDLDDSSTETVQCERCRTWFYPSELERHNC